MSYEKLNKVAYKAATAIWNTPHDKFDGPSSSLTGYRIIPDDQEAKLFPSGLIPLNNFLGFEPNESRMLVTASLRGYAPGIDVEDAWVEITYGPRSFASEANGINMNNDENPDGNVTAYSPREARLGRKGVDQGSNIDFEFWESIREHRLTAADIIAGFGEWFIQICESRR